MAEFWDAMSGVFLVCLFVLAQYLWLESHRYADRRAAERRERNQRGRPPGTWAERVERHELHIDELTRLRRDLPDIQTHVCVDCDGLITSIHMTIPATIKPDLTVGGEK